MFDNIKDAIFWIENIQRFEARKNLDNMRKALKILGNPEKKYKKIHIAGTNGKGSVVMMIKNILMLNNYKVGCFISPYIIAFNERIQINGIYINDNDLLIQTNKIYKIWLDMNKKGIILTFFEVLALISFLYFAENKVDYAIIEVGIGGLLDATNIINAEACVITNIGFDHMNVLGNTLEEIAYNKLGIVKKNNYLITTVDEKLLPIFKDHISKTNSSMKWINTDDITINYEERIHFIYDDIIYELKMMGLYQVYNAVIAIEVIRFLEPNTPLDIYKKGLFNTFWPGRMELIHNEPIILLDGAHNTHGAMALKKTLDKLYKKRNKHFVISALNDKETEKMLDIYNEDNTDFVFTQIDYYRAKSAKDLFNECKSFQKNIIEDPIKAIEQTILTAQKEDVIIITGSLYFISNIRAHLLK